MNHSEVGPSPGPANTAAFPFSLAMPMRRGGYPATSPDAFADLFAQLSRPQPSRPGQDAADRRPQSQRQVAGHDHDTDGSDDDATEDASPTPAHQGVSSPAITELTQETPAATEGRDRPPAATDRSPDRAAGPNGEAHPASNADEPGPSAAENPPAPSHDRRPPVPIDSDASEQRAGASDGDETPTDHAAIASDGNSRPGGDRERPERLRSHGSRPDADPRAASPPEIINDAASVGPGQAGEPPSETPQAEGGEGPDQGIWDAPSGRSRRRERRQDGRPGGREPSEREARGSQPLADSRPMADATVRGVTPTEQASALAFHEPGANPSEPTAPSGGGTGGPSEATPSAGPAGVTGAPKTASGLSSPAGGESAPIPRSAAPDAGISSFDGNATSRGQAAASSPSSAAEAEGPIDAAARVRLIQRVSRAFQQLGASGGIVRMKLAPAELGSIRIEMRVQDRQVEARVVAESEAASQLIRDHLPELRQRLESQGLRVERFDVRTEADPESWTDGDWAHGDRDDRRSRGDDGQQQQTSERRPGHPSSRGDRIGTPARAPDVSTAGPVRLAPAGGRPGIDASW